jgi:H+-transporting ATPase
MCIALFLYKYLSHDPRPDPLHVLKEVLIILIAAIPVGMQTVMTVTMALGAKQLAEKQVIVKRLSAIEELASVSILCSGEIN